MASIFTDAQRRDYERDGYVIVRGLFDAEEAAILREAIEKDPALAANFYDRKDAEGKATKMALWNHPGDSVYGLAARSRRVVDTVEEMLGGEVYHYHSKLTAKDPYEGGAWEWHQDYGYWYNNGCLFPLMASFASDDRDPQRDRGSDETNFGSNAISQRMARQARLSVDAAGGRRRSGRWRVI